MTKIYNSILDTIGETPIVKLGRMTTEDMAQIYVKVESFNPGGSVKDRIALRMIEDAEKSGKLKSGMTIIEPTSGNTGIGLAMVGAAKGYPVTLVMPETMSIERRKLMQAYGANLVLTPGPDGMKGAIAKANELAKENNGFVPEQFDNPANPKVHEETTAKEIVNAFEKNGLDAFVAGVGTGGTITGVGNELKRMYSDIKIYAVEPEESPVLEGGQPGPHKIQGIGAGFVPSILNTNIYDEVLAVSGSDAMETAREIAKKEGILVGISSGAALFAAIEVAKKMNPDQKVLVLLPDNGERYLSTELFQFNQ
ncbi:MULTISPECIES: cysteine synthase A [Enterococcus]|uniref:Cysteine synthase n=1 Tax=Enterococcus malodoratus ATCC 43197 TaxID=1158601 RepID=R2RGC5_9ENTE|nr:MULTISPECIES: cysteine synthase A [Enterococcus]BBM18043.1 cysteine synthase [Enterococcus avium]EOH82765.1 cysteine synthase A [Enterococcus malodoratus ATCC 43197]EOT70581.1 cysteine synthase A [Enterococcus malodoratus ATCC 43197]SET03636.1 cysteine synthase A [Enterococcus malodoratus]SPW86672.1 cysteine synthase [Enterococcus malodoratus]